MCARFIQSTPLVWFTVLDYKANSPVRDSLHLSLLPVGFGFLLLPCHHATPIACFSQWKQCGYCEIGLASLLSHLPCCSFTSFLLNFYHVQKWGYNVLQDLVNDSHKLIVCTHCNDRHPIIYSSFCILWSVWCSNTFGLILRKLSTCLLNILVHRLLKSKCTFPEHSPYLLLINLKFSCCCGRKIQIVQFCYAYWITLSICIHCSIFSQLFKVNFVVSWKHV